jgi:hypothetical protein
MCRENSSFIRIQYRPIYVHSNISPNSSHNEKRFRQKLYRKPKHTFCIQYRLFRKPCCLWDNVENYGTAKQATDDNTIRRMRFACWVIKATDTDSEHVIVIAFQPQQWLRERASTIRYSTLPLLLVLNPAIRTVTVMPSVVWLKTQYYISIIWTYTNLLHYIKPIVGVGLNFLFTFFVTMQISRQLLWNVLFAVV